MSGSSENPTHREAGAGDKKMADQLESWLGLGSVHGRGFLARLGRCCLSFVQG